ncbi:hypothetical protein SAMN05421877_107172 [Sphingobacterium lactis]|uniref:Uncharacterized protein n=1 Tax=Sphingobacterium lactis TaxID=797291 RepID=A0A1H5ZTN2_9SPHI|nr:hypothetical protein SAMN05421877_107172 [Sphingobacterium lactis]
MVIFLAKFLLLPRSRINKIGRNPVIFLKISQWLSAGKLALAICWTLFEVHPWCARIVTEVEPCL